MQSVERPKKQKWDLCEEEILPWTAASASAWVSSLPFRVACPFWQPVLWILDLPSQLLQSHKPICCSKHMFHLLPLVEPLMTQWSLTDFPLFPKKRTAKNMLRRQIYFFSLCTFLFSEDGDFWVWHEHRYSTNIHMCYYEPQTIVAVHPGAKLKGDPEGPVMKCQSNVGSETSLTCSKMEKIVFQEPPQGDIILEDIVWYITWVGAMGLWTRMLTGNADGL